MSYDTIARESIFKVGSIHLLFQAALQPDPRLDGVPFAGDLIKTDQQRDALRLFLARTLLGRPFIAPPNIPDDRLTLLRDAFERALKDPELVREANASGLHPRHISANELQKYVTDAYQNAPETVVATRKALTR